MGIALAQIEVRPPAEGLYHLPPQVAAHHPRRHVGGTHQGGQGTGVMATEPEPILKQKNVEIGHGPGPEAVAKGLIAEPAFGRREAIPIRRQRSPLGSEGTQPG